MSRGEFTEEDYLNGRMIARDLSIFDCDRPVLAAAAYVMTTAERAADLKQKPVYIWDHTESMFSARSLVQTIDDTEEWTDIQAQRSYNGSGITADDIDICSRHMTASRCSRSTSLRRSVGAASSAERRMTSTPVTSA